MHATQSFKHLLGYLGFVIFFSNVLEATPDLCIKSQDDGQTYHRGKTASENPNSICRSVFYLSS